MLRADLQASSGDCPALVIRDSPVHGRGAFASRDLAAGECIAEYLGERIDRREAMLRRQRATGDDALHTFLFGLSDGRIVDGGAGGSDARWMNHSCEPNCEPFEEGGRLFLRTRKAVPQGVELNFDYRIDLGDPVTRAHRQAHPCRCGSRSCRGTLLSLARLADTSALRTEEGGPATLLCRLELGGCAASLAMMLERCSGLRRSERDVLDELQRQSLTRPQGPAGRFSFLDLKRAAEAMGVQAAGYANLSLDDLAEHGPWLVQTSAGSVEHMAVLHAVDAARVYLQDPLHGSVSMTIEEFLPTWPSRSGLRMSPPASS